MKSNCLMGLICQIFFHPSRGPYVVHFSDGWGFSFDLCHLCTWRSLQRCNSSPFGTSSKLSIHQLHEFRDISRIHWIREKEASRHLNIKPIPWFKACKIYSDIQVNSADDSCGQLLRWHPMTSYDLKIPKIHVIATQNQGRGGAPDMIAAGPPWPSQVAQELLSVHRQIPQFTKPTPHDVPSTLKDVPLVPPTPPIPWHQRHVDGSTHLQSPQSTRPGRLQLPSCRCNGFVWLNLLSDPTVTVTHRTLRHETIETTFMARNATGSAFPVPKPAKLELWVGCKWLEVRILLLKHVS